MFNIIIFLLGAGIMFFMALRSVLARRRLCTQGQKVTATVEGTVRSRDGGAYDNRHCAEPSRNCSSPAFHYYVLVHEIWSKGTLLVPLLSYFASFRVGVR